MATGRGELPVMHPVAGFRLGTASAGIKKPGRKDLVVMEIAEGSSVAAVFTKNAFCAAPVTLAKKHLAAVTPRLLLVNTGNANAGTGERGMHDAQRSCAALAELAGLAADQILPFSTGVIGEHLPMDRLLAGLPAAYQALTDAGWVEAAQGIMTTDTRPKGASYQLNIDGQVVTLTGITKGSGMIRPNMATMLAYVATDAAVDSALLQQMLQRATDLSFNRITVDGDTSTNDSLVLVATGKSGVAIDESNQLAFETALQLLCVDLAQAIIRDGEGAGKFVTVKVTSAETEQEAEKVGFTVAESPLVKTALAASDPNWGRILAAVGRAGVEDLDVTTVSVHLNGVLIVEQGGRAASYSEEAGQQAVNGDEIEILIDLSRGSAEASIWGTDLTHEYVRINAEYRT